MRSGSTPPPGPSGPAATRLADAATEETAAEGASEQAQINAAVSHIDSVTQQNAAGAEESASASEQLSGQAETLLSVTRDLSELIWGKAVSRQG